MAKKPTPAEPGSPRVLSVPPINVIKRPLQLPPMEKIKK